MNRLDCIFLYEHTPEAMQALESGEAHFSTGGLRRNDGTFMEMSKPAKMSIADLKALLNDNSEGTQLASKIQELSERASLSETGIAELQNLQWANSLLARQTYVMTYEGFKTVIQGVERLNNELSGLKGYMREKDIEALQNEAQRYISFLRTDEVYLYGEISDATSITIAHDLDETAAFLKSIVMKLEKEDENSFVLLQILANLITPFSYIVRRLSALFYYQKSIMPGNYEEWVNTIRMVINSKAVRNYFDYFLSLNTNLSFTEKTARCREIIGRMSNVLSAIKFEKCYIQKHTKEEYLGLPKKITQLIEDDKYWEVGNNIALLV